MVRRLVAVVVVWLLLAVVQLCGYRITAYGRGGPILFRIAWTVVVVLTLAAVVRLGWRREWTAMLMVAVVSVAGAAVIGAVDWRTLSARAFYRVHRADFAKTVEMIRKGELSSDDAYGAILPNEVAYLSVKGRLAIVVRDRTVNHPRALFLTAKLGAEETRCAVGYAYPVADDVALRIDRYLRPADCSDRIALGDGWYWLG